MSDDQRVRLYRRLPVTRDADWWTGLAATSTDGRVLYVGCGPGRLAAALAAHSSELVAVDVDPAMIAAFRDRLSCDPELAQRIRLVTAPAEELDLGDRFGLVVLPSNLLNGITDPSDRAAAVRRAARHCLPGGRVALQVLNPYWMAREDPTTTGRISPRDGGAGIEVRIDHLGYDVWQQRQRARIHYRFADDEVLIDDVDAVAIYPRELRALASQAGLEITETHGPEPGTSVLGLAGGTWHVVCRPG